MTSVMGILVFVCLIMALDLSKAVETMVDAKSEPNEAPVSEDAIRQLENQVVSLRQEYDRVLARTRDSAQRQAGNRELTSAAQAQFDVVLRDLRELEAQVEQAKKALVARNESADKRRKVDQVIKLEVKAQQLEAKLDAMRLHPRLTYIVQPGSTKKPILLELSSSSMGIGRPGVDQPAIWLLSANATQRQQVFLDWISLRDPAQDYVVILLKPSAFGQVYDSLLETIRAQRFDVGTELVEEKMQVLAPSQVF
jgi:hypothetical protein